MNIARVVRFLIAATCIVIAAPFFFSARAVQGISMGIPQPEEMEKYLTVRCVEFSMASRTVCVYPSSAHILELEKERNEFVVDFWTLVLLTRGAGIPATSWLDVAVMPGAETFVELSDGGAVYARGEGKTFDGAMEDLIVRFSLERHDERYEGRSEEEFAPFRDRGAIIEI